MKSKKIADSDIADFKIASLPTRPSTPATFGGKGYTSAEVKAAFDRLPLYIIEKYNELIGDILGEDGESVADGITTGIAELHTLKNLFEDILSGAFSGYLSVCGKTLAESITEINEKLAAVSARLGIEL